MKLGWLRKGWRRRVAPPMPVVCGAGRSGTTLLRLMLDSHPDLAMPPETAFLPLVHRRRGELTAPSFVELLAGFPTWPDFHIAASDLQREVDRLSPFEVTPALRRFYALYAARHGKPRCGDKTPDYCRHLPAIEELLPEVRFVHLVRDGRDVALSIRPLWFAPAQDAASLALWWRERIEAAHAGAAVVRHYLEIRYEDLLRNTEQILRRLCDFLELPWAPEVLTYGARARDRLGEVQDARRPDGSRVIPREQRLRQHALVGEPPRLDRIGRWRTEMSAEEVTAFVAVAGDLLLSLGYERP